MSLIYELTTPITVGDINSSRVVVSLQLTAISINFDPAYVSAGTAVLSICLVDPVSGYPVNVVYQDASALQMAQAIEAQIGSELFAKLIADAKLPPGTLSIVPDAPVAAEPAASPVASPAATTTAAGAS